MGASSGGIIIKTDVSNIDLDKVAKDLFGSNFKRSTTPCDARKSNCVYTGKTKDFLVIVNSDLADKFFQSQTTANIQRYLDYFSNPAFVFAYEEYDSGGTYSYSLIYDGVIKRQFRSESYETTIDYGELEPIELKWKNAEVMKDDLGDGEFETLYKDPEKDYWCSEVELPRTILLELLQEKVGFSSWNRQEFIIEEAVFIAAGS